MLEAPGIIPTVGCCIEQVFFCVAGLEPAHAVSFALQDNSITTPKDPVCLEALMLAADDDHR